MSWFSSKQEQGLSEKQGAQVLATVAEEGRQCRRHAEVMLSELREVVEFNHRSSTCRCSESIKEIESLVKRSVESHTWPLEQRVMFLAESVSLLREQLLKSEKSQKPQRCRTTKKAPRKKVTKRIR